jgi:hypothetical protein
MDPTKTLYCDPSAPWKIADPLEPMAVPWKASKRTHSWLPQRLPKNEAVISTPCAASELWICLSRESGEAQAVAQPQVGSRVTA